MNLSLSRLELAGYTSRQLNHFYPDTHRVEPDDLSRVMDVALDRLHFCFKHATNRRYNNESGTHFNHLYADHYLMYLWFLANTLSKNGADPRLLGKLYCLNKALHAFDCMYDTGLPDVFLVFHAVGTMLGKAKYSNFFVTLQGCTIGADSGTYPTMGQGVALAANSSIIGACNIGSAVSVSCQTSVFRRDVPDGHVIYRDAKGELIARPSQKSYAQSFFNVDVTQPLS